MLEDLTRLPGETLSLDTYQKDFSARFWAARHSPIWKIERQQEFRQPESASWRAFDEGRLQESWRLLEDNRDNIRRQFARLAEAGSVVRRVRVVEEPFSPYLYWELHSLRLRAQCGEEIHVIGPEPIAPMERAGTIPEVVTIGDSVTYRILYDADGVLEGAVRYTDPAINLGCRADIATFHRGGERLEDFFIREVARKDVTGVR